LTKGGRERERERERERVLFKNSNNSLVLKRLFIFYYYYLGHKMKESLKKVLNPGSYLNLPRKVSE
jgi:hypothetical protein